LIILSRHGGTVIGDSLRCRSALMTQPEQEEESQSMDGYAWRKIAEEGDHMLSWAAVAAGLLISFAAIGFITTSFLLGYGLYRLFG
jgi:hypothetical protein